MDVLKHDKISS